MEPEEDLCVPALQHLEVKDMWRASSRALAHPVLMHSSPACPADQSGLQQSLEWPQMKHVCLQAVHTLLGPACRLCLPAGGQAQASTAT